MKTTHIKGYEGLYTINTNGEIRSLEKYRSSGKHKGIHKEQMLKPFITRYGYLGVNLYKDGKKKAHLVHRLLSLAFISNSEGKPQINHKDGNKINNSLNNLEWCTAKENSQHAYNTGLSSAWHKGNTGKDTPTAKPVFQILKDGTRKKWDSASDAIRAFGFDSSGISRACSGEIKTHKGFMWEYD